MTPPRHKWPRDRLDAIIAQAPCTVSGESRSETVSLRYALHKRLRACGIDGLMIRAKGDLELELVPIKIPDFNIIPERKPVS